MIKLIAAADDCFGIGKDGTIPWHLPPDLKRFSRLTKNQVVLMGRGTAESLPGWLPHRYSIVVTSQLPPVDTLHFEAKGISVRYLPSVNDALEFCGYDCWVIGGETIYQQTIDMAEWLYLTRVHGDFKCDRFFPEIPDEFVEVERQSHLGSEPIPYEFITFRRVPSR